MDYEVIFVPKAENDLKNIKAYIEKDNPKKAMEWIILLRKRAQSLKQFPRRGQIYKNQDRMLTVNNGYRIHYEINETKKEVIVYRFLSPYQNF